MTDSISPASPSSLIDFPCWFPIKVMGVATPDFEQQVVHLIHTLNPEFDPNSIAKRPSQKGTYLGLTVTVHVHSQTELDAIYRALTGHPLVKMVL